jgi:phosphohistidine phosphatase
VIEEVRREKDSTQILLLAGHEPTWSDTCSLLIGGGGLRCPTAALACIGFQSDSWSRIAPARGQLLWLLPPRLLRSAGFED